MDGVCLISVYLCLFFYFNQMRSWKSKSWFGITLYKYSLWPKKLRKMIPHRKMKLKRTGIFWLSTYTYTLNLYFLKIHYSWFDTRSVNSFHIYEESTSVLFYVFLHVMRNILLNSILFFNVIMYIYMYVFELYSNLKMQEKLAIRKIAENMRWKRLNEKKTLT